MTKSPSDGCRLVIAGCGAAGMAAAASAAQLARSSSLPLEIITLESSEPASWGGSSRWSWFRIRMQDVDRIAPDFVEEFMRRSLSKPDQAVVTTLAERAVETIAWVKSMGVHFDKKSGNVAGGSSIAPINGGLALISRLRSEAEKFGSKALFQTRADRLELDNEGRVTGIWVQKMRSKKQTKIACNAVILATGGFAGSPKLLSKYAGRWASTLDVTAPGTKNCRGEGIQMALRAGARPSGQYDFFQGKTVDARSKKYDPFLQILQYGVLVNEKGLRFIDEGGPKGEVSDFFNYFGLAIAKQRGQIGYLIMDERILSTVQGAPIPHRENLIASDIPPISCQSFNELADAIKIPSKNLLSTVNAFNSSIDDSVPFNPVAHDGRSTRGISPAKSNWAVALEQPPFICYPVKCSIQFTFGGLAINPKTGVISSKTDAPIPGLFAAGEIVGLHYNRYLPGATALSAVVFGKLAGESAFEYIKLNSR